MSRLGKLPPLQSIGRAKSFDFDEPPDEDSDVDNLILEYETAERGYHYEPKHALSTTDAFGRSYKILQPGSHICKRSVEGASSFSHCKESVKYAAKYRKLKQLMESRAKLEFVKEYCAKINQSTMLVRQLECLVQEEYLTWHAICRSNFQSPPTTKLEVLGSLCEDLRVNLHHWNSLKQLIHTNQWLRSQLPVLCVELEDVKYKLNYLRSCALWWTQRLIQLGFRVLAHCDPNHLSHDTLWSITRGLEEFNAIVSVLKIEEQEPSMSISAKAHSLQTKKTLPSFTRSFPSAVFVNSYKDLLQDVKAMQFSHILRQLANERAKYAAAMTHQFFTTNEEFLTRVRAGRLPEYEWGEEKITGKIRPSSAIETSDYYTQSASNVSLGSAILRIGALTAPDLSKNDSPVTEFAAREREFAFKFLQIVTKATKLLNKTHSSHKRSKGISFRSGSGTATRSSYTLKDLSNIPGGSPLTRSRSDHVTISGGGADDDAISMSSDVSHASSTRKTVSWCDATDTNMMHKLAERYMRYMWGYYAEELIGFFEAPILRGPSMARLQLGNIMLVPDMVVQMTITMIHQTCLKDLFPDAAEHALFSLNHKLLSTTALAVWLTAYNKALASSHIDKCQPRPLQDGTYSTATARHLRDAYQPLHSLLLSLELPKLGAANSKNLANSSTEKGCKAKPVVATGNSCQGEEEEQLEAEGSSSHKRTQDSAVSREKSDTLRSVLQLYVMTSDLAEHWCVTKIDDSLRSASITSFLLLTQSDLKLLCDELSVVLRHSQAASEQWRSEINALCGQLNSTSARMQKLASSSVKSFAAHCKADAADFFSENMPRPKVWRKKTAPDTAALNHNEYMEPALDQVLGGVLAGIERLPVTSQISAVSLAVTALCDAWTQHILNNHIRFSYHGACQLGEDARYIQQWVREHLEGCDPQVSHSVCSLHVFQQLQLAVQLLCQQPHPGNNSKVPGPKNNAVSHCDPWTDDLTSETHFNGHSSHASPQHSTNQRTASASPRSRSQSANATKSGARISSHEDEHSNGASGVKVTTLNGHSSSDSSEQRVKLPNAEQWLALRVNGGSRQWPKLPNCFQSDK